MCRCRFVAQWCLPVYDLTSSSHTCPLPLIPSCALFPLRLSARTLRFAARHSVCFPFLPRSGMRLVLPSMAGRTFVYDDRLPVSCEVEGQVQLRCSLALMCTDTRAACHHLLLHRLSFGVRYGTGLPTMCGTAHCGCTVSQPPKVGIEMPSSAVSFSSCATTITP